MHVCVLERAKHSFFALPNPLSCSVMNKICLNHYDLYNTVTVIITITFLTFVSVTIIVVDNLCAISMLSIVCNIYV